MDPGILDVKNVCNCLMTISRKISCLINCIKLSLVNFILSLSEDLTFKVSTSTVIQ